MSVNVKAQRVDPHLLTLVITQLSNRLDLLNQLVFVLLQFTQRLLQFLPVRLLLLKVQFLHRQCVLQLLQSHTTSHMYSILLLMSDTHTYTRSLHRRVNHTRHTQ